MSVQVGQRLTGTAGHATSQVTQVVATVTSVSETADEFGNVVAVTLNAPDGHAVTGRIGELFEGVWSGYVVENVDVELQLHAG